MKNEVEQRARPLSKVTAFTNLRNAREKEFWTQFEQRMNRRVNAKNKQKLLKKGEACILQLEDNYFVTQLPMIGGIEPMPIKVLLTKPGTPLKIEFSLNILEYLARICTFEAQTNPTKLEKPEALS